MAKKITHILFDFDGTLADSKMIIASSLNYALKKHDLVPVEPEKVYPLIGKRNLEETFRFFYPDLTDDELKPFLSDFRQYQVDNTMREMKLFPEVNVTLKALQDKGIIMAILTTKNHVQVTKILEMLSLSRYFSLIYGNGLEYGEKPDGSCVVYILSQFPEAQREEVVMVGDSEVDALTAKNGNIRFIGISHGVDTAEKLYSCGAETVISSFRELRELTN
jgi:HAD superfamily hydrolase (TIGR01549 family)